MALSNNEANNVYNQGTNMGGLLAKMRDCHNTFNYVTDYLSNWAEGTEIGADVQQKSKSLCNSLDRILNSLNEVIKQIMALAEEQIRINKG